MAARNQGRAVQLRPLAWAKLTELQEEYTIKYGRRIKKTEIIEAALAMVEQLEAEGVRRIGLPVCQTCEREPAVYVRDDRQYCADCLAKAMASEGLAGKVAAPMER